GRRSETDRPASLPRGIDRETIVKAEADHGDRGGYSRGCGAVARVRRGRRGHGDRRHGHGLRRRQDGRCGPPAGARTGARREPAAMNLNEKVLTRADRIILGGALLTLALLHTLGTAGPWSWISMAVAVGVLALAVW